MFISYTEAYESIDSLITFEIYDPFDQIVIIKLNDAPKLKF